MNTFALFVPVSQRPHGGRRNALRANSMSTWMCRPPLRPPLHTHTALRSPRGGVGSSRREAQDCPRSSKWAVWDTRVCLPLPGAKEQMELSSCSRAGNPQAMGGEGGPESPASPSLVAIAGISLPLSALREPAVGAQHSRLPRVSRSFLPTCQSAQVPGATEWGESTAH